MMTETAISTSLSPSWFAVTYAGQNSLLLNLLFATTDTLFFDVLKFYPIPVKIPLKRLSFSLSKTHDFANHSANMPHLILRQDDNGDSSSTNSGVPSATTSVGPDGTTVVTSGPNGTVSTTTSGGISISVGAIVGIVIAILAVLAIAIGLCIWCCIRKQRKRQRIRAGIDPKTNQPFQTSVTDGQAGAVLSSETKGGAVTVEKPFPQQTGLGAHSGFAATGEQRLTGQRQQGQTATGRVSPMSNGPPGVTTSSEMPSGAGTEAPTAAMQRSGGHQGDGVGNPYETSGIMEFGGDDIRRAQPAAAPVPDDQNAIMEFGGDEVQRPQRPLPNGSGGRVVQPYERDGIMEFGGDEIRPSQTAAASAHHEQNGIMEIGGDEVQRPQHSSPSESQGRIVQPYERDGIMEFGGDEIQQAPRPPPKESLEPSEGIMEFGSDEVPVSRRSVVGSATQEGTEAPMELGYDEAGGMRSQKGGTEANNAELHLR